MQNPTTQPARRHKLNHPATKYPTQFASSPPPKRPDPPFSPRKNKHHAGQPKAPGHKAKAPERTTKTKCGPGGTCAACTANSATSPVFVALSTRSFWNAGLAVLPVTTTRLTPSRKQEGDFEGVLKMFLKRREERKSAVGRPQLSHHVRPLLPPSLLPPAGLLNCAAAPLLPLGLALAWCRESARAEAKRTGLAAPVGELLQLHHALRCAVLCFPRCRGAKRPRSQPARQLSDQVPGRALLARVLRTGQSLALPCHAS
jgi:hypothetical protein